MSFRRSFGTGSYGGNNALVSSGGYSSRGYSGYTPVGSGYSPGTNYGVASGYGQPAMGYGYGTYSGSSPYSSSTYNSSSPYGGANYNSTSYTPSTSFLNATGSNPSTGSSRVGRSSSLQRSKSLPRERRDREMSLQRYTPSYNASTYTPSYTSGYTNSYLATRGLIKKARSKSSSSVTSPSDAATTNTLTSSTAPSSGYGSSASSVSGERTGEEARKGGSSTSLASRSSSVPADGEIDYKKLYEEQLSENERLVERLRVYERDLRGAKEAIESANRTNSSKLASAETDRREKRALERKLSEMEEELRVMEQLRQENKRLRDENGALIRVISKLSR